MSEGARYRRDIARLEAEYAKLPTVQCKGLCWRACGPIPLTELEARRLQLATHKKPRTLPVNEASPDLHIRCIYLNAANRCSAYAARPLICRTWGVVKMLSCMHGCLPDRWLHDRAFLRIAQTVEAIGGGRQVVTTPEGLSDLPASVGGATCFADVPLHRPGRSDEAIAEDAERTRSLRALHGGRILYAMGRPSGPLVAIDVDKEKDAL